MIDTVIDTLTGTFEYIRNTFASMRWQDWIDIFIVAVIIYYAVRFIRDKRAAKLLVGMFFILVVYFIGGIFDMYAISFLLTNVFQVGIIAIIVIFQSEIRSALEKVGGTPINQINMISDPRNIQKTLESVDIIAQVASDCSAVRRGALIVIERTTKLGDIIKEGTVLRAEMSVKLLSSIFYDKAPLHDGAVIISNNLIEAAGCILPMSDNTELLKNVGMRHRAGLGISENSDAVVVIISEESGAVSVAVDGRLDRNYNRASLKRELTHLLAAHSTRKKVNKKIKRKR